MWFTGPVLFLVRHGRTDANARGLLQGRLDPPLDETGRAQAAAAARMIGGADEVISSSLCRARETAGFFGRTPTIDDRWIEIAYGDLEGVPVTDVPDPVWRSWREDPDYRTPGGESFGDLDARVRAACDELRDRIHGRTVVVVSHASPIKAAVAWALGAPMTSIFHAHLGQGTVCRIGAGRFGPMLHSFNEPVVIPEQ